MGRTTKPVVSTIPAVGKLADYQRQLRARAGLTYDQLAALTGLSATTLRDAANGKKPPPKPTTVVAAVTACGGSAQVATDLWREARYHHRLKDNPRPPAPALRLVRSEADLSAALVELYEKAGAPTMAAMEEQAGGHGRLGHSTAHRIVTRRTLPGTRQQLEAFLDAVDLKQPAARRRWLQTWDRVMEPTQPTGSSVKDIFRVLLSPPRDSKEFIPYTGFSRRLAEAQAAMAGDLAAYEAYLAELGVKQQDKEHWLLLWSNRRRSVASASPAA
ncbi:helix-turn-helix transcriptional regulator [Streptomyces sp. NPDC006207]